MNDIKAWIPMYIGDYLKDTTHLSAAEHGAYLLLIFRYWASGGALEDNDEALRRITSMERNEWKRSRVTILQFFTLREGYWHHDRIDKEIATAQKNREKNLARTAAATAARSTLRSTLRTSVRSPLNGEGEGSLPEEEVTLGSGGRDTGTTDPDWEDSQ